MNIKETAVTNAVNLSFFMVNFSYALLKPFRQQNSDYSILDLKSHYRGYRYASEIIKMLPQKPDAILLTEIFQHIAQFGAIHPVFQPSASPQLAKVLLNRSLFLRHKTECILPPLD